MFVILIFQCHFHQAIALLNSSHQDEVIRWVQDLAATCQSSETLQCHIIDVSPTPDFTIFLILEYTCQSYLHVGHAIIVFEGGHYSKAADQLMASITTIANLFPGPTIDEPALGEHGPRLNGHTDTFTEVHHYEAIEDTCTD
jgi:hypothetical protein